MADQENGNIERKYPYLRFWVRVANRLGFDDTRSIFYYKNIPALVWVVVFNPFTFPVFVIMSAFVSLIYFLTH